MKLRIACAALALAVPFALHPAANDSILGFDRVSQTQEVEWEQQARAIPDAARIGEFIKQYSNQPHLAGTPQSKQTAESILAQLREYGLDAQIEQFEALLPTPKVRVLEMTAPSKLRLKLEEPVVPGDKNSGDPGMIPAYNAYSGDGDVTAPLVYVNYGLHGRLRCSDQTRYRRKRQDRDCPLRREFSRHETENRQRARRHRLHHLFRSPRRRLFPGRRLPEWPVPSCGRNSARQSCSI